MYYPDVPGSQKLQAINVDELMSGPRLIKKDFTNKLTHMYACTHIHMYTYTPIHHIHIHVHVHVYIYRGIDIDIDL